MTIPQQIRQSQPFSLSETSKALARAVKKGKEKERQMFLLLLLLQPGGKETKVQYMWSHMARMWAL